MTFLEVDFPDAIAQGAVGGPEFSTDVIVLSSGFEQRNARWSEGRGRFDVSTGLKDPQDFEDLIAFAQVVRGRLFGFRFKHWLEYKSIAVDQPITKDDQIIGNGDGSTTIFQTVKNYTVGVQTVTKDIKKLKSGYLLAIEGILQNDPADYTIDLNTGLVTLTSAAGSGDNITSGYEFDIPVRFNTDIIQLSHINRDFSQWQQVILREIRV